jgi:carboxylesterase
MLLRTEISPIMPNSRAVTRFTNREKGVLLIHGFKGSPFEMKYLGNQISKIGYSLAIPRLPGHGTVIEDMLKTTGQDWLTAAREALIELKSRCREVAVVGQSMGGILAILLASEFVLPKIALISVPCSIKEKSIYLAPLVGRFKKILWKEDHEKGLACEEARRVHESYSSGIPVLQSAYLFTLIRQGMKALPGINDASFLLIQSRNDRVIPMRSIDVIFEAIGSSKKEKILLEKSNHALTVDLEKHLVADAIVDFLKR